MHAATEVLARETVGEFVDHDDAGQREPDQEEGLEEGEGPEGARDPVKTLLNGSFDQTLESQMELEARAIADLSATADGQEGIHSFLEKRKPKFIGA